ncbi:Holliday junction branch migration protein RuvA [Candidatus Roizmanbacteria bacterium CG22_combo_CG10-13_8_21_14_all_38_20]|uniref:Holliday junction branch migration complex subunit RuvA n=1 Tax=Candidatus Roizmanbacteria bacterium CG22_combo_CG10-13_8_21_14_all_38_20 TaxID=1974862 RepID=A0A2H0BVD1_9BACT|nr:MAG: Holliday junction branch migration protein RuvA [Candidatus Roizmanbacteria bacterium CG22_combo_CG10-13_8_21_14_all_38_20]PJC31548.1 MAG: Holliday junction branch migration protein RuvA [Candidatus Roizmanbacteria bacterium CG_4_9_14_0_2_um_filter_38_17]
MIGYLEGKIIKVVDDFVIVLVGGVGYRVHLVPSLAGQVQEGSNIKLYTHTYVKEDALSLFGFSKFEELEAFEVLISISGIGPKLGFSIITTTSIDDLKQAVLNTDVSVLTRIPGIGKRSADKIMLELSSKFKVSSNLKNILFSPEDDLAIKALEQLGYTGDEARKAIKKAGGKGSLEEKIMTALKGLNDNK